jgi:sporulation protein YlmC with PRC-barrel domain
MNYRLTLLEDLKVVGDDGKEFGRLMDIRAHARLGPIDRPERLEAEAFLIGASGWLQQMGLREGGARELPAKSIVAIDSERVIVRVSATASRQPRAGRKKR